MGAILLGLVGAGFLGYSAYLFSLNTSFAANDVGRVSGIVDQKDEQRTKGGIVYGISFHYSVLHDTIYTKDSGTRPTGDGLHVGSSIPIKYLKDSPQTCRIDLPAEDASHVSTLKLTFFSGAICALLCVYVTLCGRRTNPAI